MELFHVVSVEEAKKIINESFNDIAQTEKVGIAQCLGRVISKDIVSYCNVPGFRRSAVDGYAVKSSDVAGANESIPSILTLKGEVLMGKEPPGTVYYSECYYVPTGGMLPEGTDCVIMIEYTDKLDDETVLCNSPAAPGENVVEADEDIKQGEVLIQAGSRLRPYEVGVLSSIGCTEVEVYKKTRIGVISTGDEVVDPEVSPKLGQVRDINTYLLHSLIKESGAEPFVYGVAGDEFGDLAERVNRAYQECDIVLISGGSSVGKKDQTLKVLKSLPQSKILVHGIAVKPGKPTIIAKSGEKIIFGLPGHPLACAVVYKVIVRHYLENLIKRSEQDYPVACKFSVNYHKAKGREEYLPVVLNWEDCDITASPVFGKAGLITGFSKAWGYVKIERNVEGLKAGEKVFVYKF